MATTTNKPCSDTASNPMTQMTATTTAQSGPCCVGLECVEKPRFFCGQLLTDLDLEATMNYIAAKNRLHNRYLFGAGVVCGLSVRCDPCNQGSIIIDPGYALDCEGDDIIVCAPQPFDVTGYLDCRKKQQAGCNGTKPLVPKDCETPEVEYCLVISYDEKPTKPVSALIRDNGCRVSRCEPSRTLEVFKLDLIDQATAQTLNVRPTVWSRITACIKDEGEKILAFLRELAAAENLTGQAQADALQQIVARLKQAILDFSQRINPVHCDLINELCAIDANFRIAYQSTVFDTTHAEVVGRVNTVTVIQAVRNYFLLYVQLLIDCICNAFLIPCNDCCDPEYVLLACLKVRNGKVINICNTVRTQVVAGTSIRYWLQPLFDAVGRVMEYLCCTLDLTQFVTERSSFNGMNMKVMQTMNAYRMAKAYSSTLMQNAKNKITEVPVAPPPGVPPAQSSSLNYYQQPVEKVQNDLSAMGVKVTIRRAATVEEAYSLSNIPFQTATLDRGATVEVLVAPDNNVAGIRKIQG
jgi:hypothetical protein